MCLFVHSSYSVSPINLSLEFSALEIAACDVCLGDSLKQRFVCVYRPPSDTVGNARLIKRCLDSLCSVSYAVCVTGDFNLPGIDWDTF